MAIKTEYTNVNQSEAKIEDEVSENEEKRIQNENTDQWRKEHFVLIHGFGHGSWCWYKIKTLMENSGAGYKVTCIDLKGAGINLTDPNTVLEFDDYNKPLLDFLSALPDNEQVILVGHSAGGLSITDASYKYPQKIKLAVYISAIMLKNGFATPEDFQYWKPDLSEFGDDVLDNVFGLGTDQPPTSVVIKQQFLRPINYHLSPLEDSTLASMLVRPGPFQAVTKARFNINGEDEADKVKRIYIKTTKDKVLKIEYQEAMVKKWRPCFVYSLETDHSPFFSTPFLLFGLLIKAIASF